MASPNANASDSDLLFPAGERFAQDSATRWPGRTDCNHSIAAFENQKQVAEMNEMVVTLKKRKERKEMSLGHQVCPL